MNEKSDLNEVFYFDSLSLAFTIVRIDVALVRLCNAKLEIELKEGIKHDSYTRKIKQTSCMNVIVMVCVLCMRNGKHIWYSSCIFAHNKR